MVSTTSLYYFSGLKTVSGLCKISNSFHCFRELKAFSGLCKVANGLKKLSNSLFCFSGITAVSGLCKVSNGLLLLPLLLQHLSRRLGDFHLAGVVAGNDGSIHADRVSGSNGPIHAERWPRAAHAGQPLLCDPQGSPLPVRLHPEQQLRPAQEVLQ